MLDAQYDLIAIGRPYTDIIAHVDDRFLENFGLAKGKIREIPPALMLAIRSELVNYTVFPGGSPPNTCAGIQALGGKAVFLGKVCDDASGRAFRNSFPPGGVLFPNESYKGAAHQISGSCYVLITPDEVGTVVNSPGVGDILTEADMFPALIENSKLLYLQAHFLFADTSKDAVIQAIAIAQSKKREVVVSLHDHRMNTERAAIFKQQHVPNINMLIGNRDEFELLFRPLNLEGMADGKTLMIMTDGANGAYVSGRGDFLHIPPHVLKARDNTVGAGDAFAAGFFFGYVHGLKLADCGDLGAETASAILEIPGARPVDSWQDIADKYLANAPQTLQRARVANRVEEP